MSLVFYKPNKAVKGFLLNINFTAKTDTYQDDKVVTRGDKSVYFSFVAQTGWDEKNSNGTFKDGAKCNIKFNDIEAAGMIAAIRANTTLAIAMNTKSVFHSSDSGSTGISFGPNFKKVKQGDKWVDTDQQTGFSIRIVKSAGDQKETFGMAFTFADSERLVHYLTNAIRHIDDALHYEQINKLKKKAPAKASPAPEKEIAPEEEPSDF